MKDALEAESYGAFPHYDEPPLKRARFYGPNLPMPVLTQATPILDKLEVVASITRPVSVDRELPSPQLALASPILNSPVVPPSMIRPEHPRDQQLAAAAALCMFGFIYRGYIFELVTGRNHRAEDKYLPNLVHKLTQRL